MNHSSRRSLFAAILAAVVAPTLAMAATITEFLVPTAGATPRDIVVGPDGNLWFTEYDGNKIGRITIAGVITEFMIPMPGSQPIGITAGPDGKLWFTEGTGNKIGSITTAGLITEYTVPTAASLPRSIVTGPDGKLWFTEGTGNKIGSITTAGVFAEYPIPGGNLPRGITVGPDGNIWFTEEGGNRVGNVTTTGTFTVYTVPTAGGQPIDIITGPDGNLWFAEANGGKIAKVTTAGVFTEFTIPTAGSTPRGINPGPDGKLWFGESAANKLGSVTTAGIFSEYPVPTVAALNVFEAVTGPDGNLWFTEYQGNKIGVLTDPSFATCGNGVKGLDEVCDDGNVADGDCCSSTCQSVAADGSPCEDGQYCTVSDTCSGGQCFAGPARDCADTTPCTTDSCDETGNVCTHAATPRNPATCLVAPSTKLTIKDSTKVGKDKLSWDWDKGEAFAQAALGTPNTDMGTSYTLCVYDNTATVPALKASLAIAPSPTLWTSKDPKGLQYKDKVGTPDGVTKAQLKTGDAAKTKVKVSAQGTNLVLPLAATGSTFFDPSNVVVQLVNSDGHVLDE